MTTRLGRSNWEVIQPIVDMTKMTCRFVKSWHDEHGMTIEHKISSKHGETKMFSVLAVRDFNDPHTVRNFCLKTGDLMAIISEVALGGDSEDLKPVLGPCWEYWCEQ